MICQQRNKAGASFGGSEPKAKKVPVLFQWRFRLLGLAALGMAMTALGANAFEISDPSQIPNAEVVDGIGKTKAFVPLRGGVGVVLAEPVPLAEGSLSVWVKPVNWDGQTTEQVDLVRADGKECWLRVYKYRRDANKYGLMFLFGRPGGEGKRPYAFVSVPIDNWENSQWHHIAVTWSAREKMIRMFVDGEERGTSGLKKEFLPSGDVRELRIGGSNEGGGRLLKTAFDKVTLVPKILVAEEIRAEAAAFSPPPPQALLDVPASIVTIPKVAHPPKIDGVVGPGEWDAASRVFAGIGITDPLIVPGRTFTTSLCYDDENLYVLVVSPVPSMQLRADTRESGKAAVSRDDSVELFVAPSGMAAQYLQLIGNSLGFTYTSTGDATWRGPVQFANTLHELYWYAELAVPFSSLGRKSPALGERWLANFCRNWVLEDRIAFSTWSYSPKSYFGRMGEIIFGAENEAFRLAVDVDALPDAIVRGELDVPPSKGALGRVEVLTGPQAPSMALKALDGDRLKFSQKLASGRDSNVFVETGKPDATTFRASIPLNVAGGPRLRISTLFPEKLVRTELEFSENQGKPIVLAVAGTNAGARQEFPFVEAGSGKWKVEIPAATLPVDTYRFEVRMGDAVLTETLYDHIGSAEWLAWNPEQKKVPKPWTPISYSNDKIGFWGRSYRLGDGPFPLAMESRGQTITRDAIELVLEADGKPVQWAAKKEWLARDEAAGAFVSRGVSANWEVTATSRFEFDGLWWVEFEMKPKTGTASLNAFELKVPFAAGVAQWVYAHDHDKQQLQGKLETNPLGAFLPNVWIGNDEVGLTWFAESDEHWLPADPKSAVRYVPDAKGGGLRVQVVGQPLKSGGTLKFLFGLQATPIKPVDPARRKLRIEPAVGANLGHPWQIDKNVKRFHREDKEWGFTSPHVTSLPALKEETAKWRAKGMSLPWYVAPDIMSPKATEYQVFREEWRNIHAIYQFACVNSSFANFTEWTLDRMIRDADLRAVYVDCARPYPCGNAAHGCGYKDSQGNQHLTTPVLALRRYLKNLYYSLHEAPRLNGLPNALVAHISGGLTTVAHGFSDIVLEGEELQYRIAKTPSYFDLYPPDKWRTIFGQGFGLNVMLLPNYGRVGDKADQQSEACNATFLTQALLNDTPIWNLWCNSHYIKRIVSALDTTGWTEAGTEFLPYWRQQSHRFDNPAVVASVYRTPTTDLVVLGNPTKEAQTVRFSGPVDLQSVRTLDATTGKFVALSSDSFTLAPENFLVLSMPVKTQNPKNPKP